MDASQMKIVFETSELVRKVEASFKDAGPTGQPAMPTNPGSTADKDGEYHNDGLKIPFWKGLSEGTGFGRLMGRPLAS